MAQRYSIHTKTQKALYKEYRNLLRRTKKFKGDYLEFDTGITNILNEARKYLSLPKLNSRSTAEIKRLASEIHSFRGEKLKKQYVNKRKLSKFVGIDEETGEITTVINYMSLRDEELASMVIEEYKSYLRQLFYNPKTGKTHHASGDRFKGLDEILEQLDRDIRDKGLAEVASLISQYAPPTMETEKYEGEAIYDFLATIGEGYFEVPESVTDEEKEDFQ